MQNGVLPCPAAKAPGGTEALLQALPRRRKEGQKRAGVPDFLRSSYAPRAKPRPELKYHLNKKSFMS